MSVLWVCNGSSDSVSTEVRDVNLLKDLRSVSMMEGFFESELLFF